MADVLPPEKSEVSSLSKRKRSAFMHSSSGRGQHAV